MIIAFSEPTPEPGISKIIVGTIGLLVGLVFSVAALIYYKKKSPGEKYIKKQMYLQLV